MNSFSYNLGDTEYLVFKPNGNQFDLYSGHEIGEAKKIACYKAGEWCFDSYEQERVFWYLFSTYKESMGRAFRLYIRSLKDKPKMYEFNCVRRKFNIKVTKIKRGWSDWFYGLWPTRKF